MTHRHRWGIPALLLVFGLCTAGCDINGQKSIDAALDDSPLTGTWNDGSNTLVFSGGKITGTGFPTNVTVTYSLKPVTTNSYTITVTIKNNATGTAVSGTDAVSYIPGTTGTYPSPATITFAAGVSSIINSGSYQKQ